MTNNIALKISNLCYHYKGNWSVSKILAIDSINLEIKEGEAFGFIGPNGAGKTTTIKCILGLVHPSNGSIEIFGTNSKDPHARKNVGYLPEQPYFYDHLTVWELISFYAHLAGISPKLIKDLGMEALSLVNMQQRIHAKMRTLSKGLTQRVAMAQAIVAKPKILILDEPFSGLDPIGRKEFKDLIFKLKKMGTTIFMSSHILSDVEFLCDRASVTVKGKMKDIIDLKNKSSEQKGKFELIIRSKHEISNSMLSLADSSNQENNLLVMNFLDRNKAVQALKLALENDMTIESYCFQHNSLEDTFVEIVKNS
jgi:ABC-2 type transport system ATP-binding protein